MLFSICLIFLYKIETKKKLKFFFHLKETMESLRDAISLVSDDYTISNDE
jgi:hypothetical protein